MQWLIARPNQRAAGVRKVRVSTLTKPAPAVLYHHYHGGEYGQGKDELFKTNWINGEGPGEGLVKQGYVVLCIDAYCFGQRQGKGPGGPTEKGKDEELSWAKINLLKGRSLFGMMIRDDRMALTYLSSRPEIDPARMAAVGMSLGCLRSFWLAALDTRIKATVAVACLVRNQELIRNERLNAHGIYYYIPGLLTHFDNESVVACIAPRPLLTLFPKTVMPSSVGLMRAFIGVERAEAGRVYCFSIFSVWRWSSPVTCNKSNPPG